MGSTTLTFSTPTEENIYLKEQIQQFEALVDTLQSTILNQQHQLEDLIKRLYGRSSEKIDPNQLLMQELILEADKNTIQKTEDPLSVISETVVATHVRPKYACGDCRCDGCGVKQHPTPEGPIERCEADAGLLAYVIDEKFEYHTPLYRQESRFESQGIQISRQTMGDWLAGSAMALTPLYELMRVMADWVNPLWQEKSQIIL